MSGILDLPFTAFTSSLPPTEPFPQPAFLLRCADPNSSLAIMIPLSGPKAQLQPTVRREPDERLGTFVVRFWWWRSSPRADATASRTRTSSTALRRPWSSRRVANDPVRYLVLGPDRAGNLLELVVLDRPQGPAVIHAMKMRTKDSGPPPRGEREETGTRKKEKR